MSNSPYKQISAIIYKLCFVITFIKGGSIGAFNSPRCKAVSLTRKRLSIFFQLHDNLYINLVLREVGFMEVQ